MATPGNFFQKDVVFLRPGANGGSAHSPDFPACLDGFSRTDALEDPDLYKVWQRPGDPRKTIPSFLSEQNHALLGAEPDMDRLSLLLGQVVGHLHADHGVVHVHEEIQEIAQVGLVGNGALEEVLPLSPGASANTSTSSGRMEANTFWPGVAAAAFG